MTNLSLMDLAYMQDMSSQVCGNSNVNDTKQLVDRRDGKKYWVAKLADNNCWMTQNLDLDLAVGGLTTALSDITTDWTDATNSTYPPSVTQTGSPSGFGNGNVIQSWDPGTKICAGYKKGCVDPNIENYDEHYLQGNYYSFNAATAGQGASKSSGNIENSSICPKNWQLPISNSVIVNKSFGYLLSKYGLTSDIQGVEVNGATYSLNESPLYFVYGGNVVSSSLTNAGSVGHYWSSTAQNNYIAYSLYFYTSINPSADINNRGAGNSVRCVAK